MWVSFQSCFNCNNNKKALVFPFLSLASPETSSMDAQDKMRVKPMEEMLMITSTTKKEANTCDEKKVIKAAHDEKELLKGLKCPRCNSSNTKFCYYNNYSQTQPRYFCKTCKRYWTHGGSLRSIPVGGKIRKNKTHSSSSTPATLIPNPNPKLSLFNHAQHGDHDLHHYNAYNYHSPMEVVTGIGSSRGSVMASNFMPMQIFESNPNPVSPLGFIPIQGDFRPSLGFSLDDFGSVDHHKADDNHHQDHINGDQHEDSTGFWTGNILGGAGSW